MKKVRVNKDFLEGAEVEVKIDVTNLFKPCVNCGEPSTHQTTQGAYMQSIGSLPQNHGYYCDKCYQEGVDRENEAMYG